MTDDTNLTKEQIKFCKDRNMDTDKINKDLKELKNSIIETPKELAEIMTEITDLMEMHNDKIAKYFYGKYPLLFRACNMEIIAMNLPIVADIIKTIKESEYDLTSDKGKSMFQTSLMLALAVDDGKEIFAELDKFLAEET